jgi:hypothetical protein
MSFNNISSVEHAANQERVHRVNVEKGWFDKPVSFLDAMALLTTEIVEANDAYHDEGLLGGWAARPQLASELADCYIRLVDDCSRFGVDLGLVVDIYRFSFEPRASKGSFDGTCMQLMRRVREVIESYRKHGLDQDGTLWGTETAKALAHLYLQLQDTCDAHGVDLMKATDLKMTINEARPYRHGNKVA